MPIASWDLSVDHVKIDALRPFDQPAAVRSAIEAEGLIPVAHLASLANQRVRFGVIFRHRRAQQQGLLYPFERTSSALPPMSGKCPRTGRHAILCRRRMDPLN